MKNIEMEIQDRINVLQKRIDSWPSMILKLKEIEKLLHMLRKDLNEIKKMEEKYEK